MNRRSPDFKKSYSRVESRKDYIEPVNTEELLDILENTGELVGVLSPKFVNERLLIHYHRFQVTTITSEEKKIIINKAWNLSRPTLHQVIRKFKKTIDVYPHIRDDILSDCSVVVARIFRENKYDLERQTRLTSFIFEFFIYSVLGSLSRYFKEKKKYVSIDPNIMSKVCAGDMGDMEEDNDHLFASTGIDVCDDTEYEPKIEDLTLLAQKAMSGLDHES